MLSMLIRVQIENVQDLVDKFQCIFLETFQIYLHAVMCLIEHISHYNNLNFNVSDTFCACF